MPRMPIWGRGSREKRSSHESELKAPEFQFGTARALRVRVGTPAHDDVSAYSTQYCHGILPGPHEGLVILNVVSG